MSARGRKVVHFATARFDLLGWRDERYYSGEMPTQRVLPEVERFQQVDGIQFCFRADTAAELRATITRTRLEYEGPPSRSAPKPTAQQVLAL